jgi:hypothetical protein
VRAAFALGHDAQVFLGDPQRVLADTRALGLIVEIACWHRPVVQQRQQQVSRAILLRVHLDRLRCLTADQAAVRDGEADRRRRRAQRRLD